MTKHELGRWEDEGGMPWSDDWDVDAHIAELQLDADLRELREATTTAIGHGDAVGSYVYARMAARASR